MSIHNGTKQGQITETVLLSGDPLRVKNIAETKLADMICFNQVRGMLGFTGTYNRKRGSAMSSGMDYAPTANLDLLRKANYAVLSHKENVQVIGILSSDNFYYDDPDY